MKFLCPASMEWDSAQILERGEYQVPVDVVAPTVLDAGACVGAFATWACLRWPGAKVTCYEPNPEAFKWLKDNSELHGPWELHNEALAWMSGPYKLRQGAANLGCSSMCDDMDGADPANKVWIHCVNASTVGSFDIVKVDTEGLEVPILASLDLSQTKLVLLEYHRSEDALRLVELMSERGLRLWSSRQSRPGLGVQRYIRLPWPDEIERACT